MNNRRVLTPEQIEALAKLDKLLLHVKAYLRDQQTSTYAEILLEELMHIMEEQEEWA